MAQQNYKDFESILKTQYHDKFENYMVGNSQSFRELQIKQIAGKDYKFGGQIGRGAGVSGDFIKAKAQASAAQNVEWVVKCGKVFSCKILQLSDYLASGTLTAAYVSSALEQVYSAFENLRKVNSRCWTYGTGYGEIGKLTAAVAAAATVAYVESSAIMAMDVGTQFTVTAGSTGLPSEAFVDSQVYTVTKINNDTSFTFTPGATAVSGWASGAYIEWDGGRDSGGNPNMPMGLEAWLPTNFERGTKNDLTLDATRLGYWNTFIATTFCGVNRSLDVKTQGNYIRKHTSEKYVQTLVKALMIARRHGGNTSRLKVLYGDNTFAKISQEIDSNSVLNQILGSGNKPKFTAGHEGFNIYYDQALIDQKIVDSYIPDDRVYILDFDTWYFIGMSNLRAIQDDGASEAEAAPIKDISGFDPTQAYKFCFDKYINVEPGAATTEGPGCMLSLNEYANFICTNPAHNVVVSFAA